MLARSLAHVSRQRSDGTEKKRRVKVCRIVWSSGHLQSYRLVVRRETFIRGESSVCTKREMHQKKP